MSQHSDQHEGEIPQPEPWYNTQLGMSVLMVAASVSSLGFAEASQYSSGVLRLGLRSTALLLVGVATLALLALLLNVYRRGVAL